MTDKLPAPCEHCSASGIFHGIECAECHGKGYRLMIDGRVAGASATEKPRAHWRKTPQGARPQQQRNSRPWTRPKP